jgi:aminopeptidase N
MPLSAAALALAFSATIGGAHLRGDSLVGTGVSRALATARAAQIRDVRYALSFDLTGRDSSRGTVTARFRVLKPGDVILDFRGQRLETVEVNGAALTSPQFNGAHLSIPARSVVVGENVVTMSFVTKIAAAGASIIRYRDATDGAEYLYTLLVPADANQLFPCFDQPDLKARVSLRLRAPANWRVLANGRETSSRAAGTGQAADHEFAETEADQHVPHRVCCGTVDDREVAIEQATDHDVRAEVARRRKRGRLDHRRERCGGAVARGLLRPAIPVQEARRAARARIPVWRYGASRRDLLQRRPIHLPRASDAHAAPGQDRDDLPRGGASVVRRPGDDALVRRPLAQEGFATYMAAKMQASLDTASGAWKSFYLRNKPLAYAVDATRGTTPVWQTLENLDQAKSNYGAIVYNKAPSVLKQLDYLVGPDAFQRGLRRFLAAHAYGNATWRDLLSAIGAESGRSLDRWGKEYILRPGMPVIEQATGVTADGRTRLVLRQRPAQTLSGKGPWPIRTSVIIGQPDGRIVRRQVTLDADSAVVPLPAGTAPPTFVYANADDYAYALVLPDERTVQWLEENISSVKDSFLRAMLWGALWDLVREARLDPARFTALALRELATEPDEQIVAGVLGRVGRATLAYLPAERRDSAQPTVEKVLRRGLADPDRPYGIRKPYLDTYIRVAGTPSALAQLDALLDSTEAAGAPLRAPTRWAIVTALIERKAPSAERRLERESRADSGSEGKRRAFVAGAARPNAEAKKDYFRRYFADESLNEDWVTASLDGFNAVRQSELTRQYLIPALDSLRWIQTNRRIFFLGSWLTSFLDGQTSAESLDAVDRFLSAHSDLPRDLREKILQAEDELARTVRIRGATDTR